MRKPISTRVHGAIDYVWAATASVISTRLADAAATARLLRTAATAATAYSFATDYEYGAVRVLPMKGHLAADAALCGTLLAAPAFLPGSERRHAAIPALLGAAGLLTVLLTDTESTTETEEFGGLYGGDTRTGVADMDARGETGVRDPGSARTND